MGGENPWLKTTTFVWDVAQRFKQKIMKKLAILQQVY